jgi:hypothetical protein
MVVILVILGGIFPAILVLRLSDEIPGAFEERKERRGGGKEE